MASTAKKKQPARKPTVEDSEIIIHPFKHGRIKVLLLGLTPFVCNRQSEKTKRELLFPAQKTKSGFRELTLKHDPLQEYQASPYVNDIEGSPTYILMKGGAFKSAACDSAVDTAELKAAQMRRLVSVPDFYVPLFGIPKIWMTDVRQAGMNRTPDIRTRVIIPEWCAVVEFTYVMPLNNETKLLHLIANGGITRGVGDGRTEKGALDFGQFTIVPLNDPVATAIMTTGGREAQEAAINHPAPFDKETKELLTWFSEERVRRQAMGATNGVVEISESELEEVVSD